MQEKRGTSRLWFYAAFLKNQELDELCSNPGPSYQNLLWTELWLGNCQLPPVYMYGFQSTGQMEWKLVVGAQKGPDGVPGVTVVAWQRQRRRGCYALWDSRTQKQSRRISQETGVTPSATICWLEHSMVVPWVWTQPPASLTPTNPAPKVPYQLHPLNTPFGP